MYKIAIIGSGQLGSRHLQGILKFKLPISIEVVDKSQESLDFAKLRADEVKTDQRDICYLSLISELSDNIDLCIIATSANVRLIVLKELLTSKNVKNLILEKVLFQDLENFEVANELIEKYKVNCWVNCPRPMFDVYKNIKSKITPEDLVTFFVYGGDWGLACNAIHFIDIMSFLTRNTQFLFDSSGIKSIIQSKRIGFVEFAGTFIGRQPNGSELILHSRAGSDSKLKIQILTSNYFWDVDEANGIILESAKENNWALNRKVIKIPFQSELSNIFSEQILLDGRCELTTYQNSMNLHLNMLNSFINFYNYKTSLKLKYCPIT
jgi:hypothetical protein